jgi:hypothetical protein
MMRATNSQTLETRDPVMRTHRYAVGQHVSYTEDYSPNKI